MASLTSRSNPKIKQARALRQRKEREASGLFVVEGISHVGAALEAQAAIQYICYAPELLTSDFGQHMIGQARDRGIPCLDVSTDVFESIAEKENPTGLLAVVHKPFANLQSLIANLNSWYVALVAPQDPGNIGTILRTVDAVGASGLILLEGGADPYHPNAVRASMGALFYQPVVSTTWAELVDWARPIDAHLIGTSAKASLDYRAAHYQRPLILLLGSEQKGLSPEQRSACEQVVRLPMEGKVGSLNLAVAAGVLLYTIKAQAS